MVRTLEHPDPADLTLQQVLDALVDPVRRRIVTQLSEAADGMSCGTFDATVSRSTLTHHFNVLREAGLIRQTYAGTTKLNVLRTEDLESRFPGLLPALLAAEA
ncbi:helix-turn-helix domain-containing protein [Kitasatospora albolonga]|uniref:ArsR/SmtB family transcription factor n=1 Tax=Kitasatospora albolonga TaxID=68173 RepID=UPI0031EE7A7B